MKVGPMIPVAEAVITAMMKCNMEADRMVSDKR